MEIAVSAVASELAGRLVSFLISKYRSQARPSKKEKLESLRRLLLRVHTVIEEAEGRYITNSRMLLQLKTLTEAMYRGYDALDTHGTLEQIGAQLEASGRGCEIQRIDRGRFITPPVRTLIVVEFRSDVDDREWHEFHSLLRALTGAGSKVVIISRLEKVARFGTVDLVRINSFSREEYGYLFKVLAFGSSDPATAADDGENLVISTVPPLSSRALGCSHGSR